MTSLLFQALQTFLGPDAREVRTVHSASDGPVFSLFPSNKLADDLRKQHYKYVRHFVILPSYTAPRWLLPTGSRRGMLASTHIYWPYQRGARFFKKLLVRMIGVGWDGCLVPKLLLASKSPLPLENIIRDVLGENHPLFALSLGTRDAVRKLTIQIMNQQGNIIGYAKLPLTQLAKERVRHEAATLNRLYDFTSLRPHIPRILYAGDYNDTYVLLQSPLEGERGPVDFNGMHRGFLESLWNVQQLTKPAHFLVDKVAASWEKAAPSLGAQWGELGDDVLRYSTAALGSTMIPFGAMHGDFAPWNTRVKQGELLLFDWESADWEAPTSWDMFHFRVQTLCSFEQSKRHFMVERISPNDILFMLYLLNSVHQFLEEGNPSAIRERQTLLTNQLYKSRQAFGDLRRPGCASAA